MSVELHVERGRIRRVLPSADGVVVRTETSTHTFPGCVAYPGFVDNHCHLYGLGKRLTSVSLHTATSAEECVQRLATPTSTFGGWVVGMGWNEELWTDRSPAAFALLHTAFAGTPVVAMRIDGHAAWINAEARRACGLDADDSSVLIDDEMDVIFKTMPAPTHEEIRSMLLAAARECSARGITEVHDMDVDPAWLEPLRELAEAGTLPIRVQSFLRAQHHEWDEAGLLPAGGEFLRVCGVKMYADGAIGSRGALLLEPYADRPDTHGIELLSVDAMVERIQRAIDAGWWIVAIHAIGDAANRNVLDAYERARALEGGKDVIFRIEHAQHVHSSDVPRFAALDVFACVQPTMQVSDASMALARLGADRQADAYRWRSLLDAGTRIGAGSDFPIEEPGPLDGIIAFTERMGPERISREEALHAYTIGAHETVDMAYRRGRLEEGNDADIVILDRDIRTCSAEELRSTNVIATITAGVVRYQHHAS
ncbi:MAG: amidohydrolase [Bacteroidetes bacterium]|nr:amidohydrolase [Bacteroidota bacterium]